MPDQGTEFTEQDKAKTSHELMEEIRERFSDEPIRCIEMLIALRDNNKAKLRSRTDVAHGVRIKAIEMLLDRMCGKSTIMVKTESTQTVDVTHSIDAKSDIALEYVNSTNDQRKMLEKDARKFVENTAKEAV